MRAQEVSVLFRVELMCTGHVYRSETERPGVWSTMHFPMSARGSTVSGSSAYKSTVEVVRW